VALAILAAIAVAACESIIGPPLVIGSGTVVTEIREVAAFTEIEARNSWELRVDIGSPGSVRLETDDNIMEVARADVDEGRLIIDAPDVRVRRPTRMRATVTVLELVGLFGSGAAKIEVGDPLRASAFQASAIGSSELAIADLITGSLSVTAQGTATIEIRGSARDVRLDISDDADARLGELTAARARAELSDSGRA
jgi:hypothetical protein